MSLLLDTHVLLWWLGEPGRLSDTTRAAIANEPVVYVSSVTAWEIAIKQALGRLDAKIDLVGEVAQEGFQHLPISIDHALVAGWLEPYHRDPFDRMLVAQAQLDDLVLVTADRDIAKYDVRVLAA